MDATDRSGKGAPPHAAPDEAASRDLALLEQTIRWMNVPPATLDVGARHGHLAFASALVGLARPRTVLVLGVHTGCNFLALCDACNAHGVAAEALAVDPGGPDTDGHVSARAQRLARLTRLLETGYPAARLIHADLATARQQIPRQTIDLLVFGGAHGGTSAMKDFDAWLDVLSDRGICLIHDIAAGNEAATATREWQSLKSRWPSIEFGQDFGLGVLFIGKDQPQAVRDLLRIWTDSPAVAACLRSVAAVLASTFPARITGAETALREQRLQAELDGLRSSRSWRLTAPLRQVAALWRRQKAGA